MVIYIPSIYLTIWNFKGCFISIVTYWLGLSIDLWKFLVELRSSNLTSTRFILNHSSETAWFSSVLGGTDFLSTLHHNLLLFKSMHDSLHTSLYFGSCRLNLRTKSLCSMKSRAPPVLWTPFSISRKKKKFIWQCDNLQHNSSRK